MKIYTIIFLIIIAITGTINAQTTPEEIFNKGLEYYYGGNYEEAITYFSDYIKSKSNDYRGYSYRGLCYQSKREYDRAIEDFTRVIGIAPNSSEGYVNRGNTYILSNNLTAATNDFTDAVRIDPNNIDALLGRSRVYLYQREFSKSMTDLNTASGVDPYNARIYISKAWVCTLTEDTTGIFDNISKAMYYDSNIVFTNNRREQLFVKTEAYKDALAMANKKVEYYPESYLAYFSRGVIYFLMNRFDFAKADFGKSIDLDKNRNPKYVDVMMKILRSIQRNN